MKLDVPPRSMWGQGEGTRGYCGETSFQSHGILFGNWISSEIARRNADGIELLIGDNDEKAATGLKFKFETFPADAKEDAGSEFVEWARAQIDLGNVVVLGFYDTDGDKDAYDHIMPIMGYKQDSAGHTLGLFYNDLYDASKSRYVSAATDVLTREECVPLDGEEQKYCIPKASVFAIALQGNHDTASVLYRMKLTIPSVDEPDWGDEDQIFADPVDFNIGCDIAGLTEGLRYTILRFESPSLVPSENFVESMAWTKSWQFTASSDSEQMNNFDVLRSDQTIYYRCIQYDDDLPASNVP